MFESKDRVGNIELLEKKIAELEGEKPSADKSGYWQRLSDYCEKMSTDRLHFINNNKTVLQAKTKMMEAFNLYLFEKFKDEFAELEGVKPLCDSYIETIISMDEEYQSKVVNAVDENIELRAKIAELERKLDDKSNSKGVGQGRGVHSK